MSGAVTSRRLASSGRDHPRLSRWWRSAAPTAAASPPPTARRLAIGERYRRLAYPWSDAGSPRTGQNAGMKPMDRLRRLCLSLPEAYEERTWGRGDVSCLQEDLLHGGWPRPVPPVGLAQDDPRGPSGPPGSG